MEIDLETELEILKAKLEDLKKCTESKSNLIIIGKKILEIGLLYNKLGNDVEALKCYNEFLEIKNQPNEIFIECALIKIGTLYSDQRNFEEALKCYKELLENYKRTLEPNNLIIADTLNTIGELYQSRGKHEKALKYYEQSLEIKKQLLPLDRSLIASQLKNIGLLYGDQGKYEKALTYLNASFEMFKQAMPMKNVVRKIRFRLGFENQKKWYHQTMKKAIQTTDDAENLLKKKLFEVTGKLKKKKKIAIKENLPIQDKTLETKKLKFEQTELEVKTSDKEEESESTEL